MLAEPVGEFVFAEIAGGEIKEGYNKFSITCCETVAIERKKRFRDHSSGSLVSIDERVVAGEAIGIRGGQRSGIRIAILRKIARPGKCAFKQAIIAHALCPAVFGKLLGMRRARHV